VPAPDTAGYFTRGSGPAWYENRGEYELSEAIDLLIQSGRTIDAIRMDGWRVDVGYPEDRDKAEQLLGSEASEEEPEATAE